MAQITGELLDVPSRDLSTSKHQRGGCVDDVKWMTVGPGAERGCGTLQLLLSGSFTRRGNSRRFNLLRFYMKLRLVGLFRLETRAQSTGLHRLLQVRKDCVVGHGGERLPTCLRCRYQQVCRQLGVVHRLCAYQQHQVLRARYQLGKQVLQRLFVLGIDAPDVVKAVQDQHEGFVERLVVRRSGFQQRAQATLRSRDVRMKSLDLRPDGLLDNVAV
ncbi:hypothetical protein FQZ97_601860 [compost metagenome]